MKIYDNNLIGTAASETHRTQETQKTDRGSSNAIRSAGGSGGDHVEFSGSLGRLSRALSGVQTDHAARVQALAAQYQSGTYRVDSAAVSRGIVQEALTAGM
jgi:anti-sigma28 factor (negative regulator of flagellin synthesis)